MITHVVCIILGLSQPGVRISIQGDYWMVQFKKKTEWVNSNQCLKAERKKK